jgi:hypothetical protein
MLKYDIIVMVFSWPLKISSLVDVLSEKSEMAFLLIQSCFKHSIVIPVGKNNEKVEFVNSIDKYSLLVTSGDQKLLACM